jgi:hypothetical protein
MDFFCSIISEKLNVKDHFMKTIQQMSVTNDIVFENLDQMILSLVVHHVTKVTFTLTEVATMCVLMGTMATHLLGLVYLDMKHALNVLDQ